MHTQPLKEYITSACDLSSTYPRIEPINCVSSMLTFLLLELKGKVANEISTTEYKCIDKFICIQVSVMNQAYRLYKYVHMYICS